MRFVATSSGIENRSQRTEAVGTKSQCTVPSDFDVDERGAARPGLADGFPERHPGSWAIPFRLANVRRARAAPKAR